MWFEWIMTFGATFMVAKAFRILLAIDLWEREKEAKKLIVSFVFGEGIHVLLAIAVGIKVSGNAEKLGNWETTLLIVLGVIAGLLVGGWQVRCLKRVNKSQDERRKVA